MEEKIDLSLNRSLPELESSYWEFIEATEQVKRIAKFRLDEIKNKFI